jgi:protease I
VAFVKEACGKGKVIASICHGGSVLVSAGVAKGRRLTSFMAIKDDLVAAGGNFVDEEVVRDGNLITSRKPEDLPAFCKSIIESLL